MCGTTYYERNKDVIEEKSIKREYGRNRYHNMSEEKRQRIKEYQKTK